MFRTVSRRFAASAWKSAESLAQIEAAYQTGINVSKAQGIASRGLLDGKFPNAEPLHIHRFPL